MNRLYYKKYYDRIIRNNNELNNISNYIHTVRTIHLIVSINKPYF